MWEVDRVAFFVLMGVGWALQAVSVAFSGHRLSRFHQVIASVFAAAYFLGEI